MPRKSPIKPEEQIGKKFGRLTIVGLTHEYKPQPKRPEGMKVTYALCKCDCGNDHNHVRLAEIVKGGTLSCGCYKAESARKRMTGRPQTEAMSKAVADRNRTHGLSKHPLYSVWLGMRTRCHNPNTPCYNYYGGRGIEVCLQWRDDFKAFHDWALAQGWEKGLEIDRIDNDKGYSPENCQLSTRSVNVLRSRRPASRRKASGLPMGVHDHRGKYKAVAHRQGATVHLGVFDTPEQAHQVYTSVTKAWDEVDGKPLREVANV